MSVLKNNYESRLRELKKNRDHLNEVINGIKKENSVLNKSLTETKAENTTIRNNYDFIMDRNENLQKKLNEVTEMMQIKSIDDQSPTKTQHNVSERL